MAENKDSLKALAPSNGLTFAKYYQDGVDVSAADDVTDLASAIVSSSTSDYLFVRNSGSFTSSQYTLYLCDDLELSSGVFTGSNVKVYTFNVSAVQSVYWPSSDQSLSFSYDGISGSYHKKDSFLRTSVVINPSVSSVSSFSFTARSDEFFYSSITDFSLRSYEMKEVNLLACIAFILAVLGCSLWFAAIFRNVQRR